MILFFRTRIKENGGGSHKNANAIIEHLKNGHEVAVITLYPGGEGLSFLQLRRYISRVISSFLYSDDVDLVICYGHTFLWGAALFKMSFNVPVHVYVDNYLDSMTVRGKRRWILRTFELLVGLWQAKFIDKILYCSGHLRDTYVAWGLPKGDLFEQEGLLTVTRNPVPGRILAIGRFVNVKGFDILIDACSRLTIPFECHIVGDGPEKESLQQQIDDLDLTQQVKLIPWMENPSKEYAEASVYVHPARWTEPFGRTIAEAHAAGIPLLLSETTPAWNGSKRFKSDIDLSALLQETI